MKIKSRRRDPNALVGFVNFPTVESSGEGGNFVRLVVIDTNGDMEHMGRFVPCIGGYSSFHLDGCFLGDDMTDEKVKALGPSPSWDIESGYGMDVFNVYAEKVRKISLETEDRYFPNINTSDSNSKGQYISRDFLAALVLGATGWSGHFRATYKDLTDEGKDLYNSIQKLYPGCELRLLSFLDT